MPPGLVLFVGAPEATTLNWAGPGLLDTFNEPIARFAGQGTSRVEEHASPVIPDATKISAAPSWRSLPLERQYLNTGLTQSFDRHRPFTGVSEKYSQGASFFTASQISSFTEEAPRVPVGEGYGSSSESVEQVLSQFYEESYARHENVPSSQIAAVSNGGSSFTSGGTSFESTLDSPLRRGGANPIPGAGYLSNLKDIPNAAYLSSIHPQTMTVNLVVGIISIPEPRDVKTRRGANTQLVELLVGDETKSGFGVNIWFSPSQPVSGQMRNVLDGLRPQDVVLMRNVALSSFRGKVYGQSLRKEMTKVHLLYRNRVDKGDSRGCYSAGDLALGDQPAHPQVEKTRKVREWVMKFVGIGTGQKTRTATNSVNDVLPPDTQ